MTCEMTCRDRHRCRNPAAYTLESFENNVVRRLCACGRHKHKALYQVFDPNTHYEHGNHYRNSMKHINTIVTVRDKLGQVETVCLGNVLFGPITERSYWEDLYDTLEDEVSRIGMFDLQHEDDMWNQRYEECTRLMRSIEQQYLK